MTQIKNQRISNLLSLYLLNSLEVVAQKLHNRELMCCLSYQVNWSRTIVNQSISIGLQWKFGLGSPCLGNDSLNRKSIDTSSSHCSGVTTILLSIRWRVGPKFAGYFQGMCAPELWAAFAFFLLSPKHNFFTYV